MFYLSNKQITSHCKQENKQIAVIVCISSSGSLASGFIRGECGVIRGDKCPLCSSLWLCWWAWATWEWLLLAAPPLALPPLEWFLPFPSPLFPSPLNVWGDRSPTASAVTEQGSVAHSASGALAHITSAVFSCILFLLVLSLSLLLFVAIG